MSLGALSRGQIANEADTYMLLTFLKSLPKGSTAARNRRTKAGVGPASAGPPAPPPMPPPPPLVAAGERSAARKMAAAAAPSRTCLSASCCVV